MAKSIHMARIAGSVFYDMPFASLICDSLHSCGDFFFLILFHFISLEYYIDQSMQPSPALRNSLLFQLHSNMFDKTVKAPTYFEQVFITQHNMVRIYKVGSSFIQPSRPVLVVLKREE